MADTVFWTNTNNLIKQRKITQEIMCTDLSISLNTLRGWVSKNVLPRVEEAIKIASYLHTSVEYLVTGKELDLPQELLKYYSLNSDHKKMIVEMITMMYNEEKH